MRQVILVLAFSALFGGAAHSDEVTIKIENFTFNPASVTIKVGDKITWMNGDDIPHSIVEKNAKFKSKPLDTNDQFSMAFSEAGTVDYFCGFHAHMVGKIIVQP